MIAGADGAVGPADNEEGRVTVPRRLPPNTGWTRAGRAAYFEYFCGKPGVDAADRSLETRPDSSPGLRRGRPFDAPRPGDRRSLL